MEFSIKSGDPEKQRCDCLVVGIFEDKKLSDAAKSLDDTSNKAISAVLKTGDMDGKIATTLLLRHMDNISAPRVMLVGLGKQAGFAEPQ